MNQTGGSPTAMLLKKRGLPLTVESYLRFAYPDGVPRPVPAELIQEAQDAIDSVKPRKQKE